MFKKAETVQWHSLSCARSDPVTPWSSKIFVFSRPLISTGKRSFQNFDRRVT